MAKGHAYIGGQAARYIKPRHEVRGGFVGSFFHAEVHRALNIAKAQAGEGVDDDAQAVCTR
jgi:hypothetical protein